MLPGHAPLQHHQLDRQQLLEREPPARLGVRLGGIGKCICHSARSIGSRLCCARMASGSGSTTRLGEVRERPVDAAAQLAIGEAGGQRMDGHQAAGVDRRAVGALVVGVFEDELAALQDQSAAQRDAARPLTPMRATPWRSQTA